MQNFFRMTNNKIRDIFKYFWDKKNGGWRLLISDWQMAAGDLLLVVSKWEKNIIL